MTFRGRLTRYERRRRKERWHRWFAWHPVHIDTTAEGRKIVVWLTTIERCGEVHGWFEEYWTYEYRRIKQHPKKGVSL